MVKLPSQPRHQRTTAGAHGCGSNDRGGEQDTHDRPDDGSLPPPVMGLPSQYHRLAVPVFDQRAVGELELTRLGARFDRGPVRLGGFLRGLIGIGTEPSLYTATMVSRLVMGTSLVQGAGRWPAPQVDDGLFSPGGLEPAAFSSRMRFTLMPSPWLAGTPPH